MPRPYKRSGGNRNSKIRRIEFRSRKTVSDYIDDLHRASPPFVLYLLENSRASLYLRAMYIPQLEYSNLTTATAGAPVFEYAYCLDLR